MRKNSDWILESMEKGNKDPKPSIFLKMGPDAGNETLD